MTDKQKPEITANQGHLNLRIKELEAENEKLKFKYNLVSQLAHEAREEVERLKEINSNANKMIGSVTNELGGIIS